MEAAPFHNDLAEGPDAVSAHWRRAADGLRLRVVHWPVDGAKGTIILFTGRTEYAEKYGRIANDLTAAGYGLLTVDWRGQGLSDREAQDARAGHVAGFADYQMDAGALLTAATELECPKPWFMIGHSMGGCIGLRALVDGFPVEKAVFSAPMWGINMPAWVRPLPYFVPNLARMSGKGERIAPGTTIENYILATPFEDNMLTTDAETYGYLARHAEQVPEFALGGPTLDWVGHAAWETRKLQACPRPEIPVLTFLGSEEEIVSVPAIYRVHQDWPTGELRIVDGARHEIMMEAPAMRGRFLGETLDFLDA